MGAWDLFFLQETLHVHTIPRFRGWGGIWVFFWGGGAVYVREIGTKCGKLAFSQTNRALVWSKMGHSAFWLWGGECQLYFMGVEIF